MKLLCYAMVALLSLSSVFANSNLHSNHDEDQTTKLILWGGNIFIPNRYALLIAEYDYFSFTSNPIIGIDPIYDQNGGSISISTDIESTLAKNKVIKSIEYKGFEVLELESIYSLKQLIIE